MYILYTYINCIFVGKCHHPALQTCMLQVLLRQLLESAADPNDKTEKCLVEGSKMHQNGLEWHTIQYMYDGYTGNIYRYPGQFLRGNCLGQTTEIAERGGRNEMGRRKWNWEFWGRLQWRPCQRANMYHDSTFWMAWYVRLGEGNPLGSMSNCISRTVWVRSHVLIFPHWL